MPRHSSFFNDLILGALAGGAAVWAMDKLDQALYDAEPAESRRMPASANASGLDKAHVIASKAAAAVGATLDPDQVSPAGIAVHYGAGALMGGLYGAFRRRLPLLDAVHGTGFGLLVYSLQAEGLNTALSTGGRPSNNLWQANARQFIAHGFYGLVTDTILRVLGRH